MIEKSRAVRGASPDYMTKRAWTLLCTDRLILMNTSVRSLLIGTIWLAGCSSSNEPTGVSYGGSAGMFTPNGAGAISVNAGGGVQGVPPGGASGHPVSSSSGGSIGPSGAGGFPSSSGGGVSAGASPGSGAVSGGGVPGGGGMLGAGGACTDTPPPNGDTCDHAVTYGWCDMAWLNGACAMSCKKCSPSSGAGGTMAGAGGNVGSGGNVGNGGMVGKGGMVGSGGSNGAGGLPPIVGGQNGWASRYWDCCKPACGWSANTRGGTPMASCNQSNQSNGGNYDVQNACEGGSGYMCWSGAPWSVDDKVAYGFAAGSGANYVCGRCYELQFAGTGHSSANTGAQSLKGKTMIVQIINNGGVAADQLDLLIPGGGVGAYNACSKQWGTSDLGQQYGGFLAGCNGDKSCVQNKCNTVFAGKAELLAGCNWFLGWYNGADNPNLVYKQIACPAAITQRSGLHDPG